MRLVVVSYFENMVTLLAHERGNINTASTHAQREQSTLNLVNQCTKVLFKLSDNMTLTFFWRCLENNVKYW